MPINLRLAASFPFLFNLYLCDSNFFIKLIET